MRPLSIRRRVSTQKSHSELKYVEETANLFDTWSTSGIFVEVLSLSPAPITCWYNMRKMAIQYCSPRLHHRKETSPMCGYRLDCFVEPFPKSKQRNLLHPFPWNRDALLDGGCRYRQPDAVRCLDSIRGSELITFLRCCSNSSWKPPLNWVWNWIVVKGELNHLGPAGCSSCFEWFLILDQPNSRWLFLDESCSVGLQRSPTRLGDLKLGINLKNKCEINLKYQQCENGFFTNFFEKLQFFFPMNQLLLCTWFHCRLADFIF